MDIERLKELSECGRELYMLNDENLIERIRENNQLQNYLSDSVDAIDEAIARQSVKSEDVAEAIDQVEGTRRKAQKELDSLTETKSRYDHQIEIGDPWNWKWEESWHPLAVEGHKQTIKNANLVIAALQAYQPWIPVSERLPKNSEHDWVLAQITEDNGYMWIPKVVEYRERIGDWYCEELGWLKTHNGTFKVTHWKPLPEPPKGE